MRSMTGFGAGKAVHEQSEIMVQIASVNHRGVQVHVRSDLRDLAMDEMVKNEVRTALQRGSITVQIQLRQASGVMIDSERVANTWRQLSQLATELNAPMPTIDRVIALVGNENTAPQVSYEPLLRDALHRALAAITQERDREGQALTHACLGYAADLRRLLPALRSAADARANAYRVAVQARVSELLAGQPVTPEQLIREVALYAERIDVTEELVRLAAHVDALDVIIASQDVQLGRKLEFLLQEIGREINTTGAKSNDTNLTNIVLEAKVLIDQLKEQSANLM
jgi:uncharacterized protein (TIGR00255 family)